MFVHSRTLAALCAAFLAASLAVAEEGAAKEAPESAAKAAELRIEPAEARLRPGEKARFSAKAFDAQEEEVPSDLQWSATFGRITAEGEFTAGRREGACVVTATDRRSGLKATAKVTVTTADEEAAGEIEVIYWVVERRTAFLARPHIAIRFAGSNQARSARLFLHQAGGRVNQLQFATCREGQPVRFGQIFNPSTTERIEVAVYDFRNRVLATVVRDLDP